MKKILIISGHPDRSLSTANCLILAELMKYKFLKVKDIKESYPDGLIDVKREQDDLEQSELIILQFPFIWYGMPSHLKAWMESVFTQGFAFGENGNKLKNKKILLSITLGGSVEAYSSAGPHKYSVDVFLKPIELFSQYCGMEYLSPIISYSMNPGYNNDVHTIKSKSLKHAHKIKSVVKKILLAEGSEYK